MKALSESEQKRAAADDYDSRQLSIATMLLELAGERLADPDAFDQREEFKAVEQPAQYNQGKLEAVVRARESYALCERAKGHDRKRAITIVHHSEAKFQADQNTAIRRTSVLLVEVCLRVLIAALF